MPRHNAITTSDIFFTLKKDASVIIAFGLAFWLALLAAHAALGVPALGIGSEPIASVMGRTIFWMSLSVCILWSAGVRILLLQRPQSRHIDAIGVALLGVVPVILVTLATSGSIPRNMAAVTLIAIAAVLAMNAVVAGRHRGITPR